MLLYYITIIFCIIGLVVCLINIIYGETVIVLALTTYILNYLGRIHLLFCIFLGVFSTVMFYLAITKVRILRYVLSFMISIGVSYYVWYVAHRKLDLIWTIFFIISAFIVLLLMHYVAYKKICDEDLPLFNLYYDIKDFFCEGIKRRHNKHDKKKVEKKVRIDKRNFYEDLFENCENQEDLKKRYRELMKIYHPDAKNGSAKITKEIKETYERLVK